MGLDSESLNLALTALAVDRTPARITKSLTARGRQGLRDLASELPAESRSKIAAEAEALVCQDVGVLFLCDSDFPPRLTLRGQPAAPLLFFRGNSDLLRMPAAGISGSRAVSPAGADATRICSEQIVRTGNVVVAGGARGVDSIAHVTALEAGGATVVVLPEGIGRFRRNHDVQFDADRTVIVSQFAPNQPWANYTAMDRNKVVIGLSRALIVVEAGDRGGSLAAGEAALKAGRPVFVCKMSAPISGGSLRLAAAGAVPLQPEEVGAALTNLPDDQARPDIQDSLF